MRLNCDKKTVCLLNVLLQIPFKPYNHMNRICRAIVVIIVIPLTVFCHNIIFQNGYIQLIMILTLI